MPRYARMIASNEKAVYHIMSRTCLDRFPFGDVEKDELVKIIKNFSRLYFAEVMGFCIMGNHFHLLVKMLPKHNYSDSEIRNRYLKFYGKEKTFSEEHIAHYREKWGNLSEYIKDIKQTFSRYYNKKHDRRGTLWGERFKSVIVEKGHTLINCLSYIDLNPLRASLVRRPEEYRWNSIGYHVQTENRDNFLSLDFGLSEFGNRSRKERFEGYRKHLYESGSLDKPGSETRKVIEDKVIIKERKRKYKLSRADRFLYKTRYFTDSGVIGSKAFVSENYQKFKHLFESKEKKPKIISGLDGIYSMKRLTEA